MRIARITRPDAIYDASAASQTFSTKEMVEFSEEEEEGVCSEDEEGENSMGKRRRRFRTHSGFRRVRN